MCRKSNTVKSLILKLYKELSDLDFDRTLDLESLQEFLEENDRTIFLGDRQRKGKHAGLCKNEVEESLAKPVKS